MVVPKLNLLVGQPSYLISHPISMIRSKDFLFHFALYERSPQKAPNWSDAAPIPTLGCFLAGWLQGFRTSLLLCWMVVGCCWLLKQAFSLLISSRHLFLRPKLQRQATFEISQLFIRLEKLDADPQEAICYFHWVLSISRKLPFGGRADTLPWGEGSLQRVCLGWIFWLVVSLREGLEKKSVEIALVWYVCVCVCTCVEHNVCFLFFPMVGSQKVEKKSWHFQPVLTEQQFSKCGPGTPGGFQKSF